MAQSPSADRNLLFGILALQMDFINREQLIQAMHAWVLAKHRPLGEILVEQKALADDNRALLEALVQKHLALHNNDPQQSLAAVSSLRSAREELQQIADADVQASLSHVAADSKAADSYATKPPADAATLPGLRYRVLRPHAKGGLGEVYVAEDTELHREIALKEIQARHADDAGSRGRFLMEAEVTGGLEHPGIVPVYGLGSYADGRPFYAMRFIRGDNLKEAIQRFHGRSRLPDGNSPRAAAKSSINDKNPGPHPAPGPARQAGPPFESLEFRNLLGRFIDVCNAVAYAHSRGVLHRDLKPGNVMLGKFGETLVVDWGLAKVVGRSGGSEASTQDEETALRLSSGSGVAETVAGTAIGTPTYMSPEQASGKIAELGPATDVYSLGATLFTLLTNRSPVSGSDIAEIIRKVQRGETGFNSASAAPGAKVERGAKGEPGASATGFQTRIPRPLIAICKKAMALHPRHRYATPLALAEDLEHWLADEPVSAAPEPILLRTRRWMRKHPGIVSGAAASVLVAVVGLTIGAVLLGEKNQELTKVNASLAAAVKAEKAATLREAAERLQAERNAHHALGANRLLVEAGRDALADLPKHVRLRLLQPVLGSYSELLTTGAASSETTLLQAKALGTYGDIYEIGDEHVPAKKAYEQAISLLTQFTSEPHQRELARTYHNLGVLELQHNALATAEKHLLMAVRLHESLAAFGKEDGRQQLAGVYFSLARVRARMGLKDEQAIGDYKQAIAILEEYRDDVGCDRQRARALGYLGGLIANAKGDIERGEKYLHQAIEVQKRLIASVPLVRCDLATSYNDLAALVGSTDAKKAEVAYRSALTWLRELVSFFPVPDHKQKLTSVQINLALHIAGEQFAEALGLVGEALGIRQELAKQIPDEPDYQMHLVRAHLALGRFREAENRHAEAESEYEQACDVAGKLVAAHATRPPYHVALADAQHSMAIFMCANRSVQYARWPAALAASNSPAAAYVAAAHRQILLEALARFEKAVRHQHLAWVTQPGNKIYRDDLTFTCKSAASLAIELREHAAVSRIASQLLLFSNDPDVWFAAARLVVECIPLVAEQSPEAKKYADECIRLLDGAIQRGFDRLFDLRDPAFEPLHQRKGFERLIDSLGKPKA